MQWTDGKNRGFSARKSTYLPTSCKKEQSVESQEQDANSILNTVRELIKIRKQYPALNASSNQTFIEKGYPAVFERSNGEQTVIVIVNPSNQTLKKKVSYSNVIKMQNAEISDGEITLNAQSFAILLK